MTLKQKRINAGNNFINMGSKINQLQKEVQSLKDDWLMCDEVCDQKEFKNRELSKLAKEVVKNEHEWDDELAIAITNLRNYLDKQVVTKLRTDMSNEEKQKSSEKYINVRENRKVWVRKRNPNFIGFTNHSEPIKSITDHYLKEEK